MEEIMKRVHLIISGKVQGVFYRHKTKKVGNKLGLTGFVRNLSNGNVEVVAEGTEENLKKLIAFCRTGPRWANVEHVEIKYEEQKMDFKTFSTY